MVPHLLAVNLLHINIYIIYEALLFYISQANFI